MKETNNVRAPHSFHPAVVHFVKDSMFIMEGKTDTNRFYIIQDGKVRISREIDKITHKQGNIAGPGDIVSAVSVMAGFSYIETAVAHSNVTLLAIEKTQYGNLIRANPSIAMKIIQHFSQRLRALNDILYQLAIQTPVKTNDSILIQVADYYMSQRKLSQAFYAYEQYSKIPNAEKLEEAKQRMARITSNIQIRRPEYSQDGIERTYPAGSLLSAEGEKGNELYIIQEGLVKIAKISNNREVVLAILQKGDIVGEMALLEDQPRTATAEVIENCKVMAVNRENFEGLIKRSPDVVTRLTSLMAERIWIMYKQIANSMISNPLSRVYDSLLIQLVRERVSLETSYPYQCNIGFKELAEMARVPLQDQDAVLKKLFLSKKISLVDNKIFVRDPSDVLRQTEYNRRAAMRSGLN